MVTEEVGADAPIFFGIFMKKKQTRKNKLTLKDEYKCIPKLLKEERYEEAEPLFDKFVAEQSAENVGFSNLLTLADLRSKEKNIRMLKKRRVWLFPLRIRRWRHQSYCLKFI